MGKTEPGDYARRFDDLFGSREWKGRLSRAIYIEANKITAWKDRGSVVRKVWPKRVGGGRYPQARLDRPGFEDEFCAPFTIDPSDVPDEEIDAEAIEAKALELVGTEPDHYTMTSLGDAIGGRTEAARTVIRKMIADGSSGLRSNERSSTSRTQRRRAEQIEMLSTDEGDQR